MSYTADYQFPLWEMGEHIRTWLRDELGAEMGLVTVEQGPYSMFSVELPIPDQLPAVWIEFVREDVRMTGRQKRFRSFKGPVEFFVSYMRAVGDQDHPTQATIQALQRIKRELNRDDQSLHGWPSSTYGVAVDVAEAYGVELDRELQEIEELAVCGGGMTFELTLRSDDSQFIGG